MTTCFLTGATGLIGRQVVARLLVSPRVERVYALTRRPRVESVGSTHSVHGDVRVDGLGLPADVRDMLAREVTTVVHLAANTEFSQSLEDARTINRDGTLRMLELTADWPNITRWVYVSTAFVAGLRTGLIKENDRVQARGWANAYEQSKAEAEDLVREARPDWVIARSSTVVCDDLSGTISQMNAVHRALRLHFGGLAPMLPGTDASRVDVVTTEYVGRGIALAALARDVARKTFHFCAGAGAMSLDELLEVSHQAFLRAPAWQRKGIARPMRTDLETYRLFEAAVHDAGSSRVRQALRSLSHFVPQLAFPKTFDTRAADALLGETAPPVSAFWQRMTNHLVGNTPAVEAA
ncbi:MAG TPA: SDR family oxidoreductase [Gemmatimonadaceae bacterium]|nr:SDR family oxidoreductase [Gemmatimonadaceae bacterium]